MTHSVGIYSFSSPAVAEHSSCDYVFIFYHKTMHCTNSWHYNYNYNETALYDILAYSDDPEQLISICM